MTSHQTVRLRKGRHRFPKEGACVMELASMLAGEPFSDHPTSVCPVIGSLLRAYNDAIDDARRQDLYACASKVVGSRASLEVQRARAERLRAWSYTEISGPVTGLHRRRAMRPSAPLDVHRLEALGTYAVRSIRRHSDKTHAEVLALINQLLAIDPARETPLALARGAARASVDRAPERDTGRNSPGWERATLFLLRARHTVT